MKLLMNIGFEEGQDMMAQIFGEEIRLTPRDKNAIKAQDMFMFPLSKKGAYVHYESDWQILNPGIYTVFLDNQGSFSPTRGDAPVRVKLYQAPIK